MSRLFDSGLSSFFSYIEIFNGLRLNWFKKYF